MDALFMSLSAIATPFIFILLIVYTILCLVIYHKIFDVYYFDLGRGCATELFVSFGIAAMLTGLTLYVWWLVLILVIIAALFLIRKTNNTTGRVTIIIITVILSIILIASGVAMNIAMS